MNKRMLQFKDAWEILSENISDGLLITEAQKIVECNTRLVEMLGYSRSELQKIPVERLFAGLSLNFQDRLSKQAERAEKSSTRLKSHMYHKAGHKIHVEINIRILAAGEKQNAMILVHKLPELSESEQLISGKQRHRTLWEFSPSGIILEDAEGIIIDVNPAFCRFMGYNRDELIGKPVHVLAHPEKQSEVSDNIRELLAGKILRHFAKSIAKDGSVKYMELHETKIIMSNGEAGILSIAVDATEQIRADEERLKKEKMQSILEIAGAICHELHQPITVMSVNCDLILMDQFQKEEIYDKIEVVKKQISRMTEITKKLMHITKYETRKYLNGASIVDIDRATGYHDPESPENK